MGDRERVGGGAGRHQEHRDFAPEYLRDARLDPSGPRVVAVAEGEALVGAPDRLKDFGCDPGGVVAGEVHAVSLCQPMPLVAVRNPGPVGALPRPPRNNIAQIPLHRTATIKILPECVSLEHSALVSTLKIWQGSDRTVLLT